MRVRELNRGQCKTYLITCERTRRAALIDPLRDRIERYLALLAYLRCELVFAVDTHTHADHRTAVFDLGELVGARTVMHRAAPAPFVDRHVADGDILELGELRIEIIATPGHTPDSMCLLAAGRLFTGDTLMIRGTGRADLEGGDPAAQYDSITRRLFALPDDTIVLPAHDYRGHEQSTIGEERRLNPRLAGRTREQYVGIMTGLGLPLPDRVQEVLQPNQTAIDDDRIAFPTIAQLSEVRQLQPEQVAALRSSAVSALVLDVREPEEWRDEGHIPGAVGIPLRELAGRCAELDAWRHRPIVAVCRAGVRSTTAAAILTSLGFEEVSNMKGGMLAWSESALPVHR